MEEPREDPDQGAVAGRHGAVGGGHGAGDEVRRVVGGEVIAAGRARVMRVEDCDPGFRLIDVRSEEHTSELQSLMRISYAVFCLKKKKQELNESTNTTFTQF